MAYKKYYKKRGLTVKKALKKLQTAKLVSEVNKLKYWNSFTMPEEVELIRNGVLNNLLVDTAGSIHSLTALTSTNRKGLTITMKSAHYKGYLRWVQAAKGSIVTITVVRWTRQVKDQYATLTDAYVGGDTNYGHLIDEKAGAFTILHQKQYVQHDNIAEIPLDFKVPVSRIKVMWNSTGATDIEKNGIYMLVQSNKLTSERPTCALNERLTYFDS